MKRKGLVVLGILFVCYSQILLAQDEDREFVKKTAYAGEEILIYSGGWEFSTGNGWESGSGKSPYIRFTTESEVKEWFLVYQKNTINDNGWEGSIIADGYAIYATIPRNAEGVYKATIRFFGGPGVTITTGDLFIDITLTVLGENNYQWRYSPINSIISDLVSSGANINQLESILNDVKEKHEMGQYREANKLLDDLQPKVQDLKTNFYPAKGALEVTKTTLEMAKALGVKVLNEENKFKAIEEKYNKGDYISSKIDSESLKTSIDTKISQFNDAKDNIQKATSGIAELDKMLFASIENSSSLISEAKDLFEKGDYITARSKAQIAIHDIDTQKEKAIEKMDNLKKIVLILAVISILIVVVVWSKKRKSKAEESKESQILSPTMQEETISSPDIQSTDTVKEEIVKKDESEREKIRDSTLRRLARQYADGEISKEEYERLRKILEET